MRDERGGGEIVRDTGDVFADSDRKPKCDAERCGQRERESTDRGVERDRDAGGGETVGDECGVFDSAIDWDGELGADSDGGSNGDV